MMRYDYFASYVYKEDKDKNEYGFGNCVSTIYCEDEINECSVDFKKSIEKSIMEANYYDNVVLLNYKLVGKKFEM